MRKRSGKKPRAQPGHEGHHLALSDAPDTIVRHRVEVCAHCQRDLRKVPVQSVERRQVLDVPVPRLQVQEHQAERKCCPICQQENRASFPAWVAAPVQYGNGVGAIAVYLVQQHLVPYERTSEILSDLLGGHLSVGTIRQLVQRCATHLVPVEQQIKIALRQAPVIHQDETGLYALGKRHWGHVTATACLTHYQGISIVGLRHWMPMGFCPADLGHERP